MRVELRSGNDGWPVVEPLNALVYPPEVLASIVWREAEWSHADKRVLVYLGERLIAAVGLYLRDGTHDGAGVRIGGIGGVMTHPEHRGRGFASAGMHRAEDFFAERGDVDFGLLVCEPKNIGFYARLGWRVFPGELVVEQHGRRGAFTVTMPMVRAVRRPAPSGGTIDLCGLPW